MIRAGYVGQLYVARIQRVQCLVDGAFVIICHATAMGCEAPYALSVSDSVVISQGASRVLLKISYSYTDNPICYSYVCKHLQETIFVIVWVLATKNKRKNKNNSPTHPSVYIRFFTPGACMQSL